MKIVPSVLVGSMSGTSGGVVAVTCRGVQYARRYTRPKYTNTQEQIDNRNALTHCLMLWRSLNLPVMAWLNMQATTRKMTGCNLFASLNHKLVRDAGTLIPVPAIGALPPFADLAGTTPQTPSQITVTWTDPDEEDWDNVLLLLRDDATFVFTTASADTLASAETKAFTGLTQAHIYTVYAALYNATTGQIRTMASVTQTVT